jgi:D-alanyl-D-alanine carboxypeptidase (penicillin-binding protein 5/6)
MTVRDLVKGALIQSANDAAYALAAAGGDVPAFVAAMNAKARALGLADTRFVRPDGLDAAGGYSSAQDVTRLARAAMRNAAIRQIVAERTDTIAGGRILHTWNDLLGVVPGVYGVKTGHTAQAGWSEVAAARGPYASVYATILGSPSRGQRNADLSELLAWGMDRYRLVAAVDPARAYARAQLPYGRSALRLVAPRRIVRVVRVDRPLVERIVTPATVALPVRRGQKLGEVRVYAGRTLVARSPLVAARSVPRPGLLGRAGWYAGRAWHDFTGWLT